MSAPIIAVENLSKRYVLGRQRSGDGLRHAVEGAVRNPLGWLKRKSGEWRGKSEEEFWALKDVSFDVMQGEVIGIVGPNGAGKSTLLKLLSRITEPTSGRIRLRGRVASLLEVGTGFHQELTGRENIFLNGAILGMSRAEILAKFDEIVAFSEIEAFLDTPVKRYSSGMYVRLAFAIAAHLEPEILIVDEVLAVGDASFQKKCLGKMGDVANSGRTVLFVSHNMEAVRQLCRRGIWLRSGKKQGDGEINVVVQDYFNSISDEKAFTFTSPESGLSILSVTLTDGNGISKSCFKPGDDLVVEVAYHADKVIEKPYLQLIIQGVRGSCFTANMKLDGHRPDRLFGSETIACKFKSIPLLPQNYVVQMGIRAKDGTEQLLSRHDVGYFTVAADLAEYGYKGEFQMLAFGSTSVVIPYEWRFPDGCVAAVSLSRVQGNGAVSLYHE